MSPTYDASLLRAIISFTQILFYYPYVIALYHAYATRRSFLSSTVRLVDGFRSVSQCRRNASRAGRADDFQPVETDRQSCRSAEKRDWKCVQLVLAARSIYVNSYRVDNVMCTVFSGAVDR